MTTAPILPTPTPQDLLRAQAGVIAGWQVAAADRRLFRAELAARRWQRVGRCSVAHNGPLTDEQRRWVAVLHHGPDAALAGLSGLHVAGFRGFDADEISVLTPYSTHTQPRIAGVRRRSTRYFDRDAVHPTLSPPRFRVPVAAVQSAAWAGSARRAAALLAGVVQQRLARAVDIRTALVRAVDVPMRPVLFSVIGDLEGGSHALGELDAIRLCREAGLPEPTRQAIRTDSRGRRRYLDLWWELYRLAVEIDGMQHLELLVWCDDMLRQNELVIARGDTLRFPSLVLRTQPARFTDQLGRALRSRGWDG